MTNMNFFEVRDERKFSLEREQYWRETENYIEAFKK